MNQSVNIASRINISMKNVIKGAKLIFSFWGTGTLTPTIVEILFLLMFYYYPLLIEMILVIWCFAQCKLLRNILIGLRKQTGTWWSWLGVVDLKETPTCEICKIFKNTSFYRTPEDRWRLDQRALPYFSLLN